MAPSLDRGNGYRQGTCLTCFRACSPRAAPLDRAADIYGSLLKERIVFLGTEIDESAVANLICAQLLLLAAEDTDKDICLYVNSPGGSVTAGLAIYDTMQFVPCDVATTCMGLAASMGQFLLCAGAPGKRFALPHSRILMHQPLGPDPGAGGRHRHPGRADHLHQADNGRADRLHTGQPVERIEADSDRDRWFTAEEAKDYGFIDAVVERTTSVGEPAPA